MGTPQEGTQNQETKHAEAKRLRNDATNAILNSTQRHRVVVAGPGTGKTHLFKSILAKTGNGALTLSFINALVDDLSVSLHGLSEVRTLHGYAAGIIRNHFKEAKIFPSLASVIGADAQYLLGGSPRPFEDFFHKDQISNEDLEFYKGRKNYYGNYYGFSDAIYAVVRYFEKHPEKIKVYKQVLVDEFQDFNRIEVRLVELLAEKSPILIAGDDDQALYAALKHASPDHIRAKVLDTSYKTYSLPFCSRCTEVIIEATNDLIVAAKKAGLCQYRVQKQYKYFSCAEKDKESKANPNLVLTHQFDGKLPTFIRNQLAAELAVLSEDDRKRATVLVVGPARLKKTLAKLGERLRKIGFTNVRHPKRNEEKPPTLLDGLKVLLQKNNQDDNLGWRVALGSMLSSEELNAILLKAGDSKRLVDVVDGSTKKTVKSLLTVLRRIGDKKESDLTSAELIDAMKLLNHLPYELACDAIREALDAKTMDYRARIGRRQEIEVTTIPGSKGLQADYVFMVHFDDEHFATGTNGNICEEDLFGVLVALTRAKKKVYLVSSKSSEPKILNWINASRVQRLPDGVSP